MSRRVLVMWSLTPFGLLCAGWLALAAWRAHRTDPLRAQRAARAQLAPLLRQLSVAGEAERSALLLQWQRHTATLWAINHAAPPARSIPDPAWTALWLETDRALYGAKAALPADWSDRANAALAAKKLPGFQPFRLFLPGNLFPFAALVAVAFALSLSLRAADVAAAYKRGEFAAAEKTCRDAIARNPTDWVARHNLSLALAQQDRAPEAMAQAAAAFVENPGHDAVRWNYRHGSEKAGVAPGALAAFVTPGLSQTIAEHHSPGQWQRLVLIAAWIGAAALAALLWNLYGKRTRVVLSVGIVVCVLSVATILVSVVALRAYGFAADARAVIVARAGILRSIPTEAETQQKSTALSAGALAIADQTFLGWTHIAFENGQTGWIRKDELVAIWR